jgi:hypothetical protein
MLLEIFLVMGVFLSDFQSLGVKCGEMGFKNPICVLFKGHSHERQAQHIEEVLFQA